MSKDQTAPGRLDVVRVFINTGDAGDPAGEKLSDPAEAVRWFHELGLLPATEELDAAGLRRLLELREALRRELLAHNGDGDPEESWDALTHFARQAELGVRFGRIPGETELFGQGSGAQLVIGGLFALVYDAIRAGRWQRLKACRKQSCQWAFYDHSKNGSGAWCDMAICGNRLKAQRRRERSATK